MLASPLCSSASLVYFWVLFSPLFLFQYLFCWMSCSFLLPAPTHPEHELRSSFMSLSWPWNRVPHAQLLYTKWVKKFRDWASNHLEKLNVPPGESSRPRDQTRASHISCSGMWILTTGATSVGAKSLQLSPTLCDTVDTRLLCPWDSPGQSTGVGSHILLQEDNSASLLFSWNFPFSFTSQKSPSSYTQACFLVYNCYHS